MTEIAGTLYVYDHDFDPVMSGQWKTTACTRCEHTFSNHWNVGVATASAIGGRPENYLTRIETGVANTTAVNGGCGIDLMLRPDG